MQNPVVKVEQPDLLLSINLLKWTKEGGTGKRNLTSCPGNGKSLLAIPVWGTCLALPFHICPFSLPTSSLKARPLLVPLGVSAHSTVVCHLLSQMDANGRRTVQSTFYKFEAAHFGRNFARR